MINISLVGNPNCGKTTLFNALTGSNQRVGNWPGVTVAKKTGSFSTIHNQVQLTDLPGLYSLAHTGSTDEAIAAQEITDHSQEIIVNVIDACHLERHLYLTSQLLELGVPLIIALNMSDLAKQNGIKIDVVELSKELGCPVVALQAHRQQGLSALHSAIDRLAENPTVPNHLSLALPKNINSIFK